MLHTKTLRLAVFTSFFLKLHCPLYRAISILYKRKQEISLQFLLYRCGSYTSQITRFPFAIASECLSHRMAVLLLTIFTHLLAASIAALVLYWLINLREGFAFTSPMKMKIFNLHPLLMIPGFVIFSGEAMITYKAIPATRKSLKQIHLILHLIALATGVFGVYAVFKFHNELNIPHMYTLHSWIGLSTICIFGVQFLLGFFTFLFPGAKSTTRAKIAPWHVFFGGVIFFMTIVTSETGLTEKFIFLRLQKGQEALVINFIGLLMLLFGIFVGLAIVLPLRRR